jgi:ADP-heptose:LPS heptosyltransferase
MTPLEQLRIRVGYVVARFLFRKSQDNVTRFTNALSSAQRALIIMPLEKNEVAIAMSVLNMMRRRFGEQNLTIVTGNQGLEVMRILPRSQFLHILGTEISFLFLPTRHFIDRLRAKPYDVAVDLNLDFVLPSGYICRASDARVRVGFASRCADTFYNLQIQPDPTLGRKLIYERLAQCLQMF